GGGMAGPEKPQLAEPEQCQMGLHADGDRADIRSPGAGRRALGRPAQGIAMTDPADAVAPALQQKSRTYFLHEIGTIVRGRAIDTEPHGNAGFFQGADRASPRGENLVAARAMGYGRSSTGEPRKFIGVEM